MAIRAPDGANNDIDYDDACEGVNWKVDGEVVLT